jgi:deazaflavin-dependent oxidoreductase (nitroreductase family)
MRRLTRLGRPLGLKRAGKEGSATSIVRHVGRRSGRTYETPVVAVKDEDRFFVALPYGQRTDWLQNVLAKGDAVIVMDGHTYEVDCPKVVPMGEATIHFRKKRQRLHRRFGLQSALQLSQVS